MRYALYIVGFTLAQVVATGAVIAYVLSHFDHGTRGETIVVAGPTEAKLEAKVEAAKSIGRIVSEAERPLAPKGWTAGPAVRSGRAVCTPVVGPNGEEAVVVEFPDGVDHDAAKAELVAGMEADGWRKSSTTEGFFRTGSGRYHAQIDRVFSRRSMTFVVGKGEVWSEANDVTKPFHR